MKRRWTPYSCNEGMTVRIIMAGAGVAAAIAAGAALSGCITAGRPDPSRGREVADAWCSECHRISPDQPTGARRGHIMPPPVTAPSFMAVAARPGIDAAQLRQFMADLHPPMPTFRLSAAEKEDVTAYILTLRK
jgi:mono/diheme cytochrome c family protein